MSLNVGLFTGLSAIRAGQAGINTVSHNISNVSTPGYTRQRVDLAAAEPFASPDGMLGTGVDVNGIRRLRDQFLDARVRTTAADFAAEDVRSQLLSRTEAVMGEPDSGITNELSKLWDAFDDLAIEPDGIAARRQVLSQLEAVANRINGVTTAWDQLGADTTDRRKASIEELNGLLKQVAEINLKVSKSDEGKISNDLLDQRDLAIDRIAELTGATARLNSDGTMDVELRSADASTTLQLVDGGAFNAVEVSGTDELVVTQPAGDPAVPAAVGGEIGALHDFVNEDLPEQQTALYEFGEQLKSSLNAQHQQGLQPDGAQGGALIERDPTSDELVVVPTRPEQLAAAADDGAAEPGALDGRNAEQLAALRSGSPVMDSIESLVIDLGASVAGANRSAQAAGNVAVAAETSRQSQHGVSIDEEMVDLVRFQRQLEAASRVMTAVDQALDTLVNRVGIVGR